MTKERYSELLQHPKWKEKRLQILLRDGHKCRKCGSDRYLQVHHKYYIEGKFPWNHPDNCLITLCGGCHQKEHEGRTIQSFIRTEKKSKKKKKHKRIKEEIKPVEMHMGYPKTNVYAERREERIAIVNQLLMDIELRKLQRRA